MRPSRVGLLLALLTGVAAVVWGVLRVVESRGGTSPQLTWTAPVAIVLLTVCVLVATVALRRRLRGDLDRPPPNPLGVARMAVLGKASAHVGPIVGGFYLGYLVLLLPDLDISGRRDRAFISAVALLAAVGLSAAGLWLEHTCRVRGGGEDDGNHEGGPAVPAV